MDESNKKCVAGPLAQADPLVNKINVRTMSDIDKLRAGKRVYESGNNRGPSQSIITVTMASEGHHIDTRYAEQGHCHNKNVRTTHPGLEGHQTEGTKLLSAIATNGKASPTKNSFKIHVKSHLVDK